MLGRCTRFLTSKSVLGTAQRTATNISGRRADLRFDTEYDQITIKGRGDSAKFLNASHFVQRFPGSRFVELMKPNEGNPLSYEVMQKLTHEFLQLEQNHAVNVSFSARTLTMAMFSRLDSARRLLKLIEVVL